MDPEQRTHNPLVLGSNPSGPTNQPIDDAVVRKIRVTDCRRSVGQLKLFSKLFETQIPSSGIVRGKIGGSHSDKTATVSVSNPCGLGASLIAAQLHCQSMARTHLSASIPPLQSSQI